MAGPGPFAHAQLVTTGPALGEEVWGQGQRLTEAQDFMQVYRIPPSKNQDS